MRFLEKAAAHTENLSALLNDLIDISMIESGEMRMSFRYFALKEYLEDVLARVAPLAEQKGIELEMGDVRDGLKVFGDKERIKQVLVNLAQNAVKYTDEGRVEVFVEELKGKRARIVVRDTGVGMAPEDAERIFERFYRVDKARSREVGGTGLGLAIVKHILDAHQTSVEVESQPGVGSEFSFVLRR
jgi:two-component system phosphate regulon sensor histidine kinase PhoR